MTSDHPDDPTPDPPVADGAHQFPPALGELSVQPGTSAWQRQDQAGSPFDTPAAGDLSWLDKPALSDEEQAARRARKERARKKARRKRRRRRAAVILAVAASLCLALGFVWFRYLFGGIEHMPAVAGQAGTASPGTNLLLIGSNPVEEIDDHGARVDWRSDLVSSDLVMLIHVPADGSAAYVISIPGHSALPIPGEQPGRLSAAFKAGGAPLYVQTVEETTGVRMDRVITLDLNGLRAIVDELGGVEVEGPADSCGDAVVAKNLDGQQALEYIALAECMTRGDLDRVARQQNLLKAILARTVGGGTLTNPFQANRLAHDLLSHTTLEDDFSTQELVSTAWPLRRMRPGNTMFLTVPPAARPNFTFQGVDYVRLDRDKAEDLWEAVREDRLAEYVQLSGTPTG